jgi:hypothetical protein
MPDPAKPRSQFSEIGVTGLVQYAGYVREEILAELTGPRWVKNVRAMQNDPIVSAAFFVIDMLTRQVTWEVKANDKDPQGEQNAEFLRECIDDMCTPWKETISEIHSYLPWGWSWQEIVYKKRNGDSRDPEQASKFTDGRVGWAKWPIRAQESLDHWQFGPNGQIEGLWQRAAPDYQLRFIPAEKSLHFRTTSHKNNPEGRPLCKPIFEPWYFRKNIKRFEAIGIERDLAGVPYLTLPADYMAEEAPPELKATYEMIKTIGTGLNQNTMACIILPSDTYEGTQAKKFTAELLSTAGEKQIEARPVIEALNLEILLTVLADVIMMGHEKLGSFALSSNKTNLLGYALGGFLDSDEETINRYAVPRLFRLNGLPTDSLPKVSHGDIESLDLMEVANYLKTLSDAGFTPTGDQLTYLVKQTGQPVPEDPEEMRKQPKPVAPQPENKPSNSGTKPNDE